jgi:tRNA threonylcarbamoyladenosine biosynthesis protein TsaE
MKTFTGQTTVRSIEETTRLAMALARLLQAGDVVCLYGQLGAGKTYFTKGLVAGLGGDGQAVTSPTFVLMQIYGEAPAEAAAGRTMRLPVYHFDAYRLRSGQDLVDIGSDETLDGDGVSVIEWADRVDEALPPDRFDVRLTPDGETVRRVRLSGLGDRAAAVVARLADEGLIGRCEDGCCRHEGQAL